MATYTYHCRKCGQDFDVVEHLTQHQNSPHRCPKCRSEEVETKPSNFFAKTSRKS